MAPRRSDSVKTRREKGQITGKLRPADPFDLIRWLARSQSDPRKALAELVQNSLDAEATEITITRCRERGLTSLRLLDNGSGVLPAMPRAEALEYLATHVGQSLKQRLSLKERHDLIVQGKYGIGILGFWSLGKELDIATQVSGSEVWRLTLWEEKPNYSIERLPPRLDRDGSWTEVSVRGLHKAALGVVAGRRIADYLAAELRGQLLRRSVRIEVADKLARGPALRHFRVEPRRFKGEPLEDLPRLEVPGYGSAAVELYLLPPGESGRVALACEGTTVVDDVAELAAFGLAREPWTSGQLSGIIDFPAFEVAPGSRRGVVPNQAAFYFFMALESLEPVLMERLARERHRRSAALEGNLMKELRRVFRRMPQALPQYDFFPLLSPRAPALESEVPVGQREIGDAGEAIIPPDETTDMEDAREAAELFPPGPLAAVVVRPERAKILRGAGRPLTARAVDEAGRKIRNAVHYVWRCDPPLGEIEARGEGRAFFQAGGEPGRVEILVEASTSQTSASGRGAIEIVEELPLGPGDTGIPEPALIQAPMEEWRSRMREARWEVNSSHADFAATVGNHKLRLRYLLSLLSKEVVLRSFGNPADAALLEKLVEVLAYSERSLEKPG